MPTRYLISLCNNGPDRPHLLVLEPDGEIRTVSFKGSKVMGVTGFNISGTAVTLALQMRRQSALVKSDTRFSWHTMKKTDRLADTHGLTRDGEALYAVSTGKDEIVRLCDDLRVRDVLKPFADSDDDGHHINDICLHKGRIVVSMFGARRAGALRNGCLMEMGNNRVLFEGLNDPHSVTSDGDNLYVLDSPTGSLYRIGESGFERHLSVLGYARGLCLTPDHILVGKNMHRRSSRTTTMQYADRLMPNAQASSEMSRSGVYLFDRRGQTSRFIDLTDYGPEIYQISAIAA